MNRTVALSSQLEIAGLLGSRESLLWSGVPRQGLLLRVSDALLIPFSLLWGGFAFFWEWNVLRSNAPIFFALWGVPFVLSGLYIIVGRFFVDARIRANTIYGLTDQRAIILSGLFSRTTTSLALRTLTFITLQERSDRTGTIMLARSLPYSSWGSGMRWTWLGWGQSSTPAFEMIPEAKQVHDQLLNAQRAAA
jgi:hypothetical protein